MMPMLHTFLVSLIVLSKIWPFDAQSVYISNEGLDTNFCGGEADACATWNRTLEVFTSDINITQIIFDEGNYKIDSQFTVTLLNLMQYIVCTVWVFIFTCNHYCALQTIIN